LRDILSRTPQKELLVAQHRVWSCLRLYSRNSGQDQLRDPS
jgi:hypothetical protein